MAHDFDADAAYNSLSLKRRDLLRASGALAGVAIVTSCQTASGINPAVPPAARLIQGEGQITPTPVEPSAQLAQAQVSPREAIEKPTYVANRRDPVAYSVADNLFWNDIMMEHALFFVQLMPGPDLAEPRRQAEDFQRLFARQFNDSRHIDESNYREFNQRSMDLARRFSDYKKSMRERQLAGDMHSLVWPLFFEHTAREADRFSTRLGLYSRRDIYFERGEVVDFWSKIMGEHSGFIAHLLDPQEKLLIDQATKLELAFADPAQLRGSGAGTDDPVMKAAREVLDFKTVGEKGIRAGKIKSIIRPELAAHVRREAVRFIDELQRASQTS